MSFLASWDAIEAMFVNDSQHLRADFTDVTLVSEDIYWKLYWCDSGDHYGDNVREVVIGVEMEVDEVAAYLTSLRLK